MKQFDLGNVDGIKISDVEGQCCMLTVDCDDVTIAVKGELALDNLFDLKENFTFFLVSTINDRLYALKLLDDTIPFDKVDKFAEYLSKHIASYLETDVNFSLTEMSCVTDNTFVLRYLHNDKKIQVMLLPDGIIDAVPYKPSLLN